MLSGSISLYAAIDVVVATLTVFELVLAKWHGLRIDIPLENDSIVDGNMCITAELAVIGKTLAGFESDPCPCRLRPANCHD